MLLYEYLPSFIANTKEFSVMFEALQLEIDRLFEEIEKILADLFVVNSSEYATRRYEKITNTIPKLTETLYKRQLDILAIYNEVPPFTYERLQQILTSILGFDGFKISIDIENYKLYVKLHKRNKEHLAQVNNILERIVPVNLVLNYSIDWNTWEDLHKFKWAVLEDYTWKDAKENEVLNSIK